MLYIKDSSILSITTHDPQLTTHNLVANFLGVLWVLNINSGIWPLKPGLY